MDEIQKLRKQLTRLDKEKKVIQEIWSGITVNNSWESLLVNAPSSIDSFHKLMLLAVTDPAHITTSLPSTMSFSEFRPASGRSKPLKMSIVQAANGAVEAQEAGQNTMNKISQDMNLIPEAIHGILDLLDQSSSEKITNELPAAVQRLRRIVKRSVAVSATLENHLEKTTDVLATVTSAVGRSGFMLLEEVKHFWTAVYSFYDEIRKLIEYTLDSSCNAFLGTVSLQRDIANKNPKFVLKTKYRDELYRASLSTVAYTLSTRHLADAYMRYSSQIILPQLLTIARYPLIANSEIELARAQKQFKDFNGRCKNEMHQTLKTNRAANKRKSILELDLGLDVYLSDMAAELDKFLTPIANFKQGSVRKISDKKNEKKIKETGEIPAVTGKPEGIFDRLKISMGKKKRFSA